MKLKLDQIRRDDSAQPRAMLNTDHIKDLADALEGGGDLTPVDVFYDNFSYWLADGFHRFSAYHRAKRDEIPVTVHEGDLRAAVLWSITANAKHAALKLTRDEKRAGVERLLRDSEWSQWSDNEIGRRTGVDNKTVAKMRVDLGIPKSDVRRGADGRAINTAGIVGRSKAESTKADPPVTVESPPAPAPSAALSDYTRPRHLVTYSPPPLPDPEVEPDELEFDNLELDDVNEPQTTPYRPPYPTPQSPDVRIKPPDPSKRRPYVRAFTAAGALSNLSDDVIVEALLSPENTEEPTKASLELELSVVVEKISRCLAKADFERKTVTA